MTTEGDCPSCGKHFKNLGRHKCKVSPAKTGLSEAKKTKSAKKVTKTPTEKTLVPSDDYLSSGVHIGTKNKNKVMKDYIYKIRSDGLAIFDVQKIDDRLRTIGQYLAKFKPEEILIVCKRDNGAKPLKMLKLATGINTVTGRYLPGTLTNPNNDYFMEPKVVMLTDAWYDKQALIDATKSGAVIISLSNSNSNLINIDISLPCNNRGHKSLALIYWIIAREYAKANKIKFEFEQEKFV